MERMLDTDFLKSTILIVTPGDQMANLEYVKFFCKLKEVRSMF